MKELRDIIKAYDAVKQVEGSATLATIVKVKGSAFRRPGARMLIRNDGTSVGTLSSGCLEADVTERAMKTTGSTDAFTITYDTRSPQNELWGLNLGCNGIIRILIEPLSLSARSHHLTFLSHCISKSKPGVVASVFRVDGEFKAKVGSHLFLDCDGKIEEDVRNPALSAVLTEDCAHALRSRSSSNKEYRFTEGIVEALIEFVRPPLPLFIFGAGADAVPLARMAKELGWSVTVIDHRPAMLSTERFPSADQLMLVRPEDAADKVTIDPNAIAVVLTHDLTHDQELLRVLLPSHASYVGLLGPSKRAELLLEKLMEAGYSATPEQLSRLHAPIGLNIGAESPEEIALSILSEIQAFVNGRSGGFLRDHAGPIHS